MRNKRWVLASVVGVVLLLSACVYFQQAGIQAVPSKVTQLLFEPRSASPSAITGTVYYDSDDNNLYVRDNSAWTDLTNIGAPTDADYLVGTANGSLSNEIVVGATPGGQLGGTWASPTIDDLFLINSGNDTTTGTITINKANGGIILDNATAGGTDFWLGVKDDGDASDDDLFQIGDGTTFGTNPFVTVDTSGNVGIGTTGPGAKLDIGESNVSRFQIATAGLSSAHLYWKYGSNIREYDTGAGDVASRLWIGPNGDSLQILNEASNSYIAMFNGQSSMSNTDAAFTVYDARSFQLSRFQVQAGGNVIVNTGNVGIGTTAPTVKATISGTLGIGLPIAPSAGGNIIVFANAATTPTLGADTAAIFARDVGGTTELFTMDEAGNETQQTPHNFDLFSPDSSEKFPWSYYACNRYVGTCVNVDIVGAIRAIEQSSGQQFIWYEDMPEEQVLSWEEYQQAEAERENARRLAEAAAELVQVSRAEAVEQYTVTEMRPVSPTQYVTTTTTVYELDSETGQAVAREVITTEEVTETVEMGLAWRLKEGCQLDSYTGIFKCPVGEENATYEPYELQPMPDWMQDRITTIFLAPKDISGIPRPQGEYKKLVDVGNYSIWWVKAEAETLKELHALLWNMNPKETLGALAAVKTFGESFYDQRVARATGMTVQQFLTRRGKIVNYLKSLGKDTTLLSQATTEHEMVEGIVVALGYTMPQLWNAMR